jgi:hypothetical protein
MSLDDPAPIDGLADGDVVVDDPLPDPELPELLEPLLGLLFSVLPDVPPELVPVP